MNSVDMKQVILDRVMKIMAWDASQARRWYLTSNPTLGGHAPIELVSKGQAERVIELLRLVD